MRIVSGVFWFFVLILASWLIADPVGGWAAELSNSVWWAVLPWVLIALIWIYMVRQLLRRRQQSLD